MARPIKKGLDYFPLDVNIFDDDKFLYVQNEYGPLGEIIYIRLLCFVYKDGYYYKFDSFDKLVDLVIKSISPKWTKRETVIKIINCLAENKLFSKELMRENVITSPGIQRRYAAAKKRGNNKIAEYSLLEESEIDSTQNAVNHDNENDSNTQSNTNAADKNEPTTADKQAYGTYGNVLLTDEEYAALKSEYGADFVEQKINRLSEYMVVNDKDYNKKHCAVLKQWLNEDKDKQSQCGGYGYGYGQGGGYTGYNRSTKPRDGGFCNSSLPDDDELHRFAVARMDSLMDNL